MIGKIQRVPLRKAWEHEAYDFTKWLQNNIDVLNEVLPVNLSNAEREQAVGSFSVDLVAEDDDGDLVVIENQLEKSDHDHLGKLITYFTAIGAKRAIWIVADPRPEHVGAVSWLNESSSGSFYLFKLECIQIENSVFAPLLTLIVGPSEESQKVGDTKKELAERYHIRRQFWTELLDRASSKTKLHSGISPSQISWVGVSAGKSGMGFNYVTRKHDGTVELYIDRGKGAIEENTAIFDALFEVKDEIEAAVGQEIVWQRLEGKQACRIKIDLPNGGYRDDEEKWPEIQETMIDTMIRFEKALRPHVNKLQV